MWSIQIRVPNPSRILVSTYANRNRYLGAKEICYRFWDISTIFWIVIDLIKKRLEISIFSFFRFPNLNTYLKIEKTAKTIALYLFNTWCIAERSVDVGISETAGQRRCLYGRDLRRSRKKVGVSSKQTPASSLPSSSSASIAATAVAIDWRVICRSFLWSGWLELRTN